jgi:flagellar motor component MotA
VALVCLIVGAVLVAAGTALVSWKAAIIVVGGFCLAAGALIDLSRPAREARAAGRDSP